MVSVECVSNVIFVRSLYLAAIRGRSEVCISGPVGTDSTRRIDDMALHVCIYAQKLKTDMDSCYFI